MKKILIRLVQVSAVIALLLGATISYKSLSAQAPGQIVGGNQNYTIANITKGTGFANPQTAAACDTLEYRIRLYNPGPSPLSSVKVEASINTMTPYTAANSTASIYAPDAQNPTVAMQATVNISTAQTQSYVAKSTQLLDSAGHVLKSSANGTLSDSITMGGGGIELGSLGDSVTEYVKFRTKLSCPETPPVSNFSCSALDVAKIDRTHYTFTAHAAVQNATVQSYTFTVRNSANAVVDTHTITSGALSATYDFNQANAGTYTVTATIKTDKGTTEPGICVKQITVEQQQPPQPSFKCDALDVVAIDRTHFKLTAHAAVQNATVQSYTFTVKNSANATVDTKTVTSSALIADYDFNQTTPDTYTITAVIKTDKGTTEPGICVKQIKVEEQTTQPAFSCTALDVTKKDRTHYSFMAHASVQNATVQNYTFTVKNEANVIVDTKTVTSSALSASYDFSQSNVGTYTVSALITTDKGTTEPGVCVKQVTVPKEETPPSTPSTPVTPAVTSTSSPAPSGGRGGATTTVLPNTGPGDTTDIIGIMVSVVVSTAAGYYVYARRLYGS